MLSYVGSTRQSSVALLQLIFLIYFKLADLRKGDVKIFNVREHINGAKIFGLQQNNGHSYLSPAT